MASEYSTRKIWQFKFKQICEEAPAVVVSVRCLLLGAAWSFDNSHKINFIISHFFSLPFTRQDKCQCQEAKQASIGGCANWLLDSTFLCLTGGAILCCYCCPEGCNRQPQSRWKVLNSKKFVFTETWVPSLFTYNGPTARARARLHSLTHSHTKLAWFLPLRERIFSCGDEFIFVKKSFQMEHEWLDGGKY